MTLAFDAEVLSAHVADLARALGARPGDAERLGAALVNADLCGHHSHGVRQLPYYAGQVRRGEIDVTSDLEIVDDGRPFFVVDGRAGFGHVIAAEVVTLVADRAQSSRIAAAAVRNANHIGRLGEYTEMLTARGQIGILLVTCQGADQQIAPFGGIERRLTNNPLSLAVPGPEYPIVLDMALSEAAESRVLHAADLGVQVPGMWLLDADGMPSTEPRDYLAGGSLLSVGAAAGSHKGYSLIVLLELIVGLLADVLFCGPEQPPFSNSFLLIAIDPGERAAGRREDILNLVGWVKSSRLQNGQEILIPGELEARRRREAAGVVRLDSVTVEQLDELARALDVSGRLAEFAPSKAGPAAA